MKASKYLGLGIFVIMAEAFSQVPLPDNALYGCEENEGFTKLFDGTIASFRNNFVDYIQNNTTNTSLNSEWKLDVATKSVATVNNVSDIRSKAIYGDFDLRLNYKCNGNEGIYYRFDTRYQEPWRSGIEFGVDNAVLTGKYSNGAAYDLFAPSVNVYRSFDKPNPWNEIRIVAIGDSVEHWMNGIRIVKFKYFSPEYFTAYLDSKWTRDYGSEMSFVVKGDRGSGPIKAGYIGFQAEHNGDWFIKNFRINTKPSWTTKYVWPPTCVPPTSIAVKRIFSHVSTRFINGKLSVSIPGIELKKAQLINLRGQEVSMGRISNNGSAEFPPVHENGVYFLRFVSSGATQIAPLGLLSPL